MLSASLCRQWVVSLCCLKALESVCFCGTQSPGGFSYWEALWLLWKFCLHAPLHHVVKNSDVHSHQYFEFSRLYPKSVERLLISAMGFTQGANLSDRCIFLLLWNDAFSAGLLFFFSSSFPFVLMMKFPFYWNRKENNLQSCNDKVKLVFSGCEVSICICRVPSAVRVVAEVKAFFICFF